MKRSPIPDPTKQWRLSRTGVARSFCPWTLLLVKKDNDKTGAHLSLHPPTLHKNTTL